MADIFRKNNENTFFSRYFVIFAYIKNRMICAIAINILNLKPFDFLFQMNYLRDFINSADLPTF